MPRIMIFRPQFKRTATIGLLFVLMSSGFAISADLPAIAQLPENTRPISGIDDPDLPLFTSGSQSGLTAVPPSPEQVFSESEVGASEVVDPPILSPVGTPPTTDEDCWPSEPIPLNPTMLFASGETRASYTLIPAPDRELTFNTFQLEHELVSDWLPNFRLTPKFELDRLRNGPFIPVQGFNLIDVPSELYELGVEATAFVELGKGFSVLGSIAPGIYTDFENTGSGAFRLPAQVIGFYEWSERVSIAAGISYLDREDIDAVGFVGIIIGTPSSSWRGELLFPRSRLAVRVHQNEGLEHWIYVAQDSMGGASWAMRHDYGLKDIVTYRDQKVVLGYEYVVDGRKTAFVEGGYVYDRHLEFRAIGRGRLTSTGMFRVGVTF
ncbi:hypothetical protein SH668x_000482 [Planctomicrobium sp. SH668]|uniref:hypothetical protein n=1 Tax=Planctomicrobium sp. SH668 TaxID=3448126 RepID=UPI003F5AF856